MKLKRFGEHCDQKGRYYSTLFRDAIEVSLSTGDERMYEGGIGVYGDGNRIVAVYVPHVFTKVADVVTACQ